MLDDPQASVSITPSSLPTHAALYTQEGFHAQVTWNMIVTGNTYMCKGLLKNTACANKILSLHRVINHPHRPPLLQTGSCHHSRSNSEVLCHIFVTLPRLPPCLKSSQNIPSSLKGKHETVSSFRTLRHHDSTPKDIHAGRFPERPWKVQAGRDPCLDRWQRGISCDKFLNSNIHCLVTTAYIIYVTMTSIVLKRTPGARRTGTLLALEARPLSHTRSSTVHLCNATNVPTL